MFVVAVCQLCDLRRCLTARVSSSAEWGYWQLIYKVVEGECNIRHLVPCPGPRDTNQVWGWETAQPALLTRSPGSSARPRLSVEPRMKEFYCLSPEPEPQPARCGDREHGRTPRAHLYWCLPHRWCHRAHHPLLGAEEGQGPRPHRALRELGGGKESLGSTRSLRKSPSLDPFQKPTCALSFHRLPAPPD